MKIALLTIWHEKNYGAELQAYATIKVLQSLGHEVEMVDIRLSDCSHPNIKGRIVSILSKFGPSHRKFCAFWEKYIPRTNRYKTLSDLQKNPPIVDVYMVGSDQVWNPDLTKDFSSLYFLDFGHENQKRVSYASSFGVSEWAHPELREQIKKLLTRFSYVSCREQAGVELLKKEFNIKAENVIDPTLLLDSYIELTGKTLQRQTLVYYPLCNDPELEENAVKIAKQLGLKPVNNKATKNILNAIEWDRVSIEYWVKNIAEAQFVITRSFHGMVFSILHNKQFAIVEGVHGRSSRITSLLSLLGLSDRYFDSFESLIKGHPWDTPIDYSLTNIKVDSLRRESLDCLIEMLK